MTEPIRAGEDHVVGRDRAADLGRGALDKIDAVFRREMFEDHAQAGKLPGPFRQPTIDECLLPIENIDIRGDVLAVHQKRHVDLFHALENAHHFIVVGNAERGIGRRMRRVKLHAGKQPIAKAALDIVRIGVIGEI